MRAATSIPYLVFVCLHAPARGPTGAISLSHSLLNTFDDSKASSNKFPSPAAPALIFSQDFVFILILIPIPILILGVAFVSFVVVVVL